MRLDDIISILEEESFEKAVVATQAIDDSRSLHILAGNYNWDNGFAVPRAIVQNKHCDLGTALMIFYLADGYTMLSDSNNFGNTSIKEWSEFLNELFEMLNDNKFLKKEIAYVVPLTKVQLFKLKKSDSSIPEIFVSDIVGESIEIPNL